MSKMANFTEMSPDVMYSENVFLHTCIVTKTSCCASSISKHDRYPWLSCVFIRWTYFFLHLYWKVHLALHVISVDLYNIFSHSVIRSCLIDSFQDCSKMLIIAFNSVRNKTYPYNFTYLLTYAFLSLSSCIFPIFRWSQVSNTYNKLYCWYE